MLCQILFVKFCQNTATLIGIWLKNGRHLQQKQQIALRLEDCFVTIANKTFAIRPYFHINILMEIDFHSFKSQKAR